MSEVRTNIETTGSSALRERINQSIGSAQVEASATEIPGLNEVWTFTKPFIVQDGLHLPDKDYDYRALIGHTERLANISERKGIWKGWRNAFLFEGIVVSAVWLIWRLFL